MVNCLWATLNASMYGTATAQCMRHGGGVDRCSPCYFASVDHMRSSLCIGRWRAGELHGAAACSHTGQTVGLWQGERLTSNAMYLCSDERCGESQNAVAGRWCKRRWVRSSRAMFACGVGDGRDGGGDGQAGGLVEGEARCSRQR